MGGKKAKKLTKHYTENIRLCNTDLTMIKGEIRCSGRIAVPVPIVTTVLLLLLEIRRYVMERNTF